MTCKGCIYSPICKVYADFGVTDVPYDKNDTCEMFKSRSNFVEVVMCQDCEFYEHCESSLIGEVYVCTKQGAMRVQKEPSDFCSWGRKKEGQKMTCEECRHRKRIAELFDMHIDWRDCWLDCEYQRKKIGEEFLQKKMNIKKKEGTE